MAKASAYFDLEGPQDKHEAARIKKQIDSIPGVISVSVNARSGRVAVDYDTTGTGPEQIRSQLSGCGCRIASEHTEGHMM